LVVLPARREPVKASRLKELGLCAHCKAADTRLFFWGGTKEPSPGVAIADEVINRDFICCICSRQLLAQSGRPETSARLSAFGQQRTNMLAWLRPHRSWM